MITEPNPNHDILGGLLGPLTGTEIPGGCDDCHAYQTTHHETGGIWRITVHHDDTCPTWQAMNRTPR